MDRVSGSGGKIGGLQGLPIASPAQGCDTHPADAVSEKYAEPTHSCVSSAFFFAVADELSQQPELSPSPRDHNPVTSHPFSGHMISYFMQSIRTAPPICEQVFALLVRATPLRMIHCDLARLIVNQALL